MKQLRKLTISTSAILLIIFAMVSSLKAQHVEFTPFAGYGTSAKMYTTSGDLRYAGAMNFGANLSAGPSSDVQFEFGYNHMRTQLGLEDGSYGTSMGDKIDLDVDYFMFGFVKEIMPDQKATPFGSFALGWVNYRTYNNDNYGNENKFTVDFAASLKVKLNEKVGLRFQARLHLPMYFEGVYFTAGTSGAGAGLGATALMVQGDFTGGIFIVLK
jgi:hypothetical protein